VLRGAALVFFAYIGFDASRPPRRRRRNPQRDMPLGILASLAVCTVLYMAVSAVLVGIVPYQELRGQAAPMVMAIDVAAKRAGGGALGSAMAALRVLVEIGALAGITSVMLVTMLGQSRIFLAMSADGLLPEWAGRIHPRFRTPHTGTLVTGAGVALAAGFTPIGVLGQLVSIGTLLAFVIVAAGILFLRKARPDLPRPFRTPWLPWLPLGSIAVNLVLMASLPWTTWERPARVDGARACWCISAGASGTAGCARRAPRIPRQGGALCARSRGARCCCGWRGPASRRCSPRRSTWSSARSTGVRPRGAGAS
jgi:APA family basic amino acid/polyamine antiporter